MFTSRNTVTRCRLRTTVQWCVCLLLAAGLLQTWLLDGLVIPYRISGGSMAETLLGNSPTSGVCRLRLHLRLRHGRFCPCRTAGRLPELRLRGQRLGIVVARHGWGSCTDRPHRVRPPSAAAMGDRGLSEDQTGRRDPRQARGRPARRVDRDPRRRRLCRRADSAQESWPNSVPWPFWYTTPTSSRRWSRSRRRVGGPNGPRAVGFDRRTFRPCGRADEWADRLARISPLAAADGRGWGRSGVARDGYLRLQPVATAARGGRPCRGRPDAVVPTAT